MALHIDIVKRLTKWAFLGVPSSAERRGYFVFPTSNFFRNRWSLILSLLALLVILGCSASPYSLRPFSVLGGEKEKEWKGFKEFFQGIRPSPGNPDSHYLLACHFQEANRQREAMDEFEKVIVIDPASAKSYNGLGISADRLGDHEKATAAYGKAIELNPNLAHAHNNLGYSFLLQNRVDQAISALQKAVALNGKEGVFHNNLGLAYAIDGRLDLALEEFKMAGDEATANFNVARFYHERGQYHLAGVHYKAALFLRRTYEKARVGLEAVSALAGIYASEPEPVTKITLPITIDQKVSVPEAMNGVQGQKRGPEVIDSVSLGKDPMAQSRLDMPSAVGRDGGGDVSRNGRELANMGPSPEAPANKKALPSNFAVTKVEITNANGVNHMARKVGAHLKGKGVAVTRLTNQKPFDRLETTIFYQKGFAETAGYLAGELAVGKILEEKKAFARPDINIRVLLGKDKVRGWKKVNS